MTRPRILRRLRIAVTAVSGTLCLLLIALWMRSYWRADELTLASRLRLTSIYGHIQYVTAPILFEKPWDYLSWRPSKGEIRAVTKTEAMLNDLDKKKIAHLSAVLGIGGPSVRPSAAWLGSVPYWSVVCVAATLTIAIWIPWSNRFSLRTLLLTTTLVAILLGTVVYALK
jgi:hypothetical protein